MPIFQVGPRPNAVSCLHDPTNLPPGLIHCQPRILVGDRSLSVTGAPTVLRDLMNARGQAQRTGITIDGTITGGSILVRSVNFTRRVTTARPRPAPVRAASSPVAAANLARRVAAAPSPEATILFETEIEGIAIQLTATRPPGGV